MPFSRTRRSQRQLLMAMSTTRVRSTRSVWKTSNLGIWAPPSEQPSASKKVCLLPGSTRCRSTDLHLRIPTSRSPESTFLCPQRHQARTRASSSLARMATLCMRIVMVWTGPCIRSVLTSVRIGAPFKSYSTSNLEKTIATTAMERKKEASLEKILELKTSNKTMKA